MSALPRSETDPTAEARTPGRSATDPVVSSSGMATSSAEEAPRSRTTGTERPCFRGKVDVLVAGGYDYERFIFQQHAQRLGVDDALECCTQAEFRAALFKSQRYNRALPLIVFLGSESWLEDLKRYDLSKRPPFVVNVNAGGSRVPEAYHEHMLSSCTREEVAALLSRVIDCRSQSDNDSMDASAS
ncbi:unnamed protein product [Symbiodinium microadriaticum]|nr:unnamed protein product [Symbiodinium microadriaticum]